MGAWGLTVPFSLLAQVAAVFHDKKLNRESEDKTAACSEGPDLVWI